MFGEMFSIWNDSSARILTFIYFTLIEGLGVGLFLDFSSCVMKRKTSASHCEFLIFRLQLLPNNGAVNNGPSELQEAIQDVLGSEEQMYSRHHNYMEDALRFYDKFSATVQLQEKYLVEEQK